MIENSRRFRKPGCRIFLKIENLKVGDGGVAGIDLVALGKQRLGKIVGPACFGAFDLNQRGLEAVAVGLRLATLDQVVDVSKPLVDLFFVAGIAAQEKIVHVVAVQHDLVAHRLDGANVFKRGRGVFAGGLLPEAGADVDEEQQTQNYQNRPKP